MCAAIYSIIDPADQRKIVLDHNCYRQTTGDLLIHIAGRSYTPSDFARYQTECAEDRLSLAADPLFMDEPRGDYRLRDGSPCVGMGMQTPVIRQRQRRSTSRPA